LTAVDRATGDFIILGNWTASITSVAANDFLF
jgi:hypothetical protein